MDKRINELHSLKTLVGDIYEKGVLFRDDILENVYNFDKKERLINTLNRMINLSTAVLGCNKFIPSDQIQSVIDSYKILDKTIPFTIYDQEFDAKLIAVGTCSNNIAISAFSQFEYYDEELSTDHLINLINHVKGEYQAYEVDFPKNMETLVRTILFKDSDNDETKTRIAKDFIQIKNNFPSDINKANLLLKDIYYYLKDIDFNIQENELFEEREIFRQEIRRSKADLEEIKNQAIKYAYKEEADIYIKKASNYTYAILFVFLVISAAILFKVFLYNDQSKWPSHFLFITFIFSLTGLLAFLIKERTRLINLHTYCNKNNLELSALPTYMYGLTEQQTQNLKIDLAKYYFRGYEEIQKINSENTDIPKLTTNLDQVVKSITEIKNIVSK